MRGMIKERYPGSWYVILNVAKETVTDPATGKTKTRWKQKWIKAGTRKKHAEAKLADLLKEVKDDAFIDTSNTTVGEWLPKWFGIAKGGFRENTATRYKGIIDNALLTSPVASIPLQKLRASHLEAYYATAAAKLSASTLQLHHTVIHQALRKAVKDGLMRTNVAIDLDGRPRRANKGRGDEARQHAWTGAEARAFLDAAKAAGAQPAAFYALAIDSGMRKGELGGLKWENVDLEASKVKVVEQLLGGGDEPRWGPTKTGRSRTISLGAETVNLLRVHRKHQRELMMANRATYHDFGLVFSKQWSDVRKRGEYLGQPLQLNNIGQREYTKLIKAAGVRRIKFHGLRHTCATLLLQARTPVHVVSERLGHSKVSMTMEVYAHVLPDMQQDAAVALGAVLHG